MPDTTEIKVDIESLRKDIENVNTIHNRLDTAIDKLTDVSTSIKSMLAVHEEKIARQEKIDEVIFEKLKDELKVGRAFNFAAEKAVTEAWNTILVADFVSIIASVILYILAIGPIRGFALTLGLATVFDLFYTRMFIRNAVPLFGNITDNPRSYFPLTKKDIENV